MVKRSASPSPEMHAHTPKRVKEDYTFTSFDITDSSGQIIAAIGSITADVESSPEATPAVSPTPHSGGMSPEYEDCYRKPYPGLDGPQPHSGQPPARTNNAQTVPPLWEDRHSEIFMGSRIITYSGMQEEKGVIVTRIAQDAPFVTAERRFLASLLREYPDASINELTERFNWRFVDEFTSPTAFSWDWLSTGRTVESIRHEYLSYKFLYDRGLYPIRVGEKVTRHDAWIEIEKYQGMVRAFGMPDTFAEPEEYDTDTGRDVYHSRDFDSDDEDYYDADAFIEEEISDFNSRREQYGSADPRDFDESYYADESDDTVDSERSTIIFLPDTDESDDDDDDDDEEEEQSDRSDTDDSERSTIILLSDTDESDDEEEEDRSDTDDSEASTIILQQN